MFIGLNETQWCGSDPNLSVVMLSFITNSTAFFDVPVLSSLIGSDQTRITALMTAKTTSNSTSVNVTEALNDLTVSVENLKMIIELTFEVYASLLSYYSEDLLRTLKKETESIVVFINDVNEVLINFKKERLSEFSKKCNFLWIEGWKSLEGVTTLFIDSIRNNTRILKFNIIQTFEIATYQIQKCVNEFFLKIFSDLEPTLANPEGLVFQFHGGIRLLGLEILGLNLTVVYSAEDLQQCKRRRKVYEFLQDEKAIRVYGKYTVGSVDFIKVSPILKIKLDDGNEIGLSISLETSKRSAAVLDSEIRILGMKQHILLFVENEEMHFDFESKAWDLFLVHATGNARHGGSWRNLSFRLHGHFLTEAGANNSFEKDYLTAMKRYIRQTVLNANKTMSKIQIILTKANIGVTNARSWFNKKRVDVKEAYTALDDARHELELAEKNLEKAKISLDNTFNDSQLLIRMVDQVCKIKACDEVCIKGIKYNICRKDIFGAETSFPCFKIEDCMVSIQRPSCIAANALCRHVRKAAYTVLESKSLIKAPINTLKIAETTAYEAKINFGSAKVMKNINVALLDLAQLKLNAEEKTLDILKKSLEAVQKLGMLEFVNYDGIQLITDVQKCEFQIQIVRKDISVFNITCEVKSFILGWLTVKLRINFYDAAQSLWNSAKASVNALLDILKKSSHHRKRRHLHSYEMQTFDKCERNKRDGISSEAMNATLDIIPQTEGFKEFPAGGEYE